MILISILADLNNTVVRMVSNSLLIFKFFSLCINPSVIVPRPPITIGITVTYMFHNFFNSIARSSYLSFFWCCFNLLSDQSGLQSPQFWKFSFSCWLLLDLVDRPRLGDLFVSKKKKNKKKTKSLCVSFSRTGSELCIYHLIIWSNLNFLHNSQLDQLAHPVVSGFLFFLF